METFRKAPGTTNNGAKYEDLNIANIVLQLVSNGDIKDFFISSNATQFGSFDDIIVETETGAETGRETYALQLKHADNKYLSIETLKQKNGNFSISKYFTSFQQIPARRHKLILFTNKPFNDNNVQFQIEGEEFHVKVLKHFSNDVFKISEKTNYCYKFRVVEEPSGFENSIRVQEYEAFFENFFLYVEQENFDSLKVSTLEKFRRMFASNEDEFDKYTKTITEWSEIKGEKEKLNKKWMQRAIAIQLLSSRIKPVSFDIVDANMKILRKAISIFDVTILEDDSYEKVKKLWGDLTNELTDIQELNKLRRNYQLGSTYFHDINDLDETMLSKLLWLKGKCPLIVSQDATVCKAIQLCPEDKFILLGDPSVEKSKTDCSVFQNLSDLKLKSKDFYEELTKMFKCSIQEKQEITLDTLIGKDNDFLTFFKTDDLVKMSDHSYNVGGEKEILPKPYIERHLSISIIDIKYLEQISENTLIILNCNNFDEIKNKLSRYIIINVDDYFKEESEDEAVSQKSRSGKSLNSKRLSHKPESHLRNSNIASTIYLSKVECTYTEFETICNKNPNVMNCHQFTYIGEGKLEWIRSKSDFDDLKKYTLSQEFFVEERLLWHSQPKHHVNVIISDPGMGKTELVKSFKNNCHPEFWTVIIYPRDIYSFTKKLQSLASEYYLDEFKNFLLDVKFKTLKQRDKEFFNMLIQKNKVLYVWDAFDEISINHVEVITDLILQLSKNALYQWITSRPHLKLFLEKKFNVISIEINEFDEKEQIFYIKKRLEEANCDEKIEEVIEKIKSTFVLVDHKDILGIPLQIFMITELFRQKVDKYLDLLNNVFTLTDLYYHFIEEKFNIYYKEKACLDDRNFHVQFIIKDSKHKTLKRYEKIALLALFPAEILTRLNVDFIKVVQTVQDNDVSIGLVTEVIHKIPHFLHNSFAEYFAALYFVKNRALRDILEQILFDPKYANVRFFFDLMLANKSLPHIAVLYKNFDLVSKYYEQIQSFKDDGGRSVLHLACSWGQRYPRLTVKKVDKAFVIDDNHDFYVEPDAEDYSNMLKLLLEKCDLSDSDALFKMSSLTYAQKSNCLTAKLNIIHKHKTKLSDDETINILYYSARFGYDDALDLFTDTNLPFVKTKKGGKSLLHLSVSHKKYVIKLLRNDSYKKKINDRDNMGNTPLHETCYNNCHETAALLIRSGAEVNARNKNGLTAIFLASGFGHEETVKLLAKVGAQINLPDVNGFTPLYAALRKHKQVADFLIESGAKVDLPENNGFTPFHFACFHGHEKAVKLLVARGAAINSVTNQGFTPLHLASQQGHEEIVKLLVKSDAKLNAASNNGFTPLHMSCQSGHENIARFLIESGAKLNLLTHDRVTPLYLACQQGHERIVCLLVDAAAKTFIADDQGFSPLHLACQEGYQTIVEYLVKSGAVIDRSNNDGFTPLHMACQNGHKKIAEYLIASGADINFADDDGFTPLHIASQNGHVDIVGVLISSEAEVDLRDNEGFTALHVASQNGYPGIVDLLLSENNINLPSNYGFTSLYIACQNDHENIVVILLEFGADVNFANTDRFTPLHVACQKGYDRIVELLVKHGAKVNVANNDNFTPLQLACQGGYARIVKFLWAAGAEGNSALLPIAYSPTGSKRVSSKRRFKLF